MTVGDDVLTDEGRGVIVSSWGGPPVDLDTSFTIELHDGRRIVRDHYWLEEDRNKVMRIDDPPRGHPYRACLTVRRTPQAKGEP